MINVRDVRDIIAPDAAWQEAAAGAQRGPMPVGVSAAWDQFTSLRHLVNATAERIWRFGDLHPHIESLEEMIFTLDDGGLVSQMFLSTLSPAQIVLQNVAYCQWETEIERRFVHGTAARDTIDGYALAPRFRRLIERELQLLADGGQPARVLFIGSGPLPISAILVHEYLRVRVDCVDLDWMAVADSRHLLEELGLSQQVQVFHADGGGFDASPYDAILIALLAKPKCDILAAIARTARDDCRIVCRTARGLRRLLYEPMAIERDLADYVIHDQRWAINPGDTISSLLLTRPQEKE